MTTAWTLTIEQPLYERLVAHLFPRDHDEHGAVIAAGLVTTERGTRLLARDLFVAQDGTDFVPSSRGYRMLTPEFVRDRIFYCREQALVYLAVHNHGGRDSVKFSEPDDRSHERGYPALLDISGQPVGALVVAENAIAGDICTPDRVRRPIAETIIIGRNLTRQYPAPAPRPPKADATYDRQVRWFGDRGQELLRRAKVAVVDAGGVGQPLITMLARLGVGTIVGIDPDRVDPTNLPRMPEARRSDALTVLHRVPGMSPLARRLSTRKVSLARRAVRRASKATRFIGVFGDVIEPAAAREFVDCDYISLLRTRTSRAWSLTPSRISIWSRRSSSVRGSRSTKQPATSETSARTFGRSCPASDVCGATS